MRFACAIVLWMIPVFWLGGTAGPLIFAAAALPVTLLARRYPHARIGLCNVLTVGRLAITAILASRVGMVPGWFEVGLALAALSTDGVDGWAARRAQLVSRFGARLDMEVDSALALVLALLATAKLGEWVLILGIMRYVWLAGCAIWPWLGGPLPDRFSRKAICVVQICTLIVIIAPDVPLEIATVAGLAAVGLLLWSFGRDAVWRARNG